MVDIVEKYIHQLKTGYVNFETIVADDSVKSEDRVIKTMDINNNVIDYPVDQPLDNNTSAVGYIWKQLCDYPIVVGITSGIKGDHKPHYHAQEEWYYVVKGETITLKNNEYITIKEGDYFHIPSNTIHNTPIIHDGVFSVLYWFPNDAHFNTFKYYWKDNTTDENMIQQFDRIDELRKKIITDT